MTALVSNSPLQATIDGNEACARVAYKLVETIAIYPITPSSPMAESCEEWADKRQPNLFNSVPHIVEMQSEAGAAGTVHGMLQAGCLSTTFTASQGLLLMVPNMYKIAGELTPFCMHVTARSLATHALSIFGDHSDVMACRQTGFAMLFANSVQESQDMAAIAHSATLEARVPFMHIFDGFRTSHEINTLDLLPDEQLRELIDDRALARFREHALSPDKPTIRGTAQNPDVFFQAREAINPFYDNAVSIVQSKMDQFGELTSRRYGLVEYFGHPDARHVIVAMGSACETIAETVDYLNSRGGEVGLISIRLYRPWPKEAFIGALPPSVEAISVLDRTKEPGAIGEPLYTDVCASLMEANRGDIRISGGRYGLGSKEFTPAMVRAAFEEMRRSDGRRHYTVGIVDDVSGLSLPYEQEFSLEAPGSTRAVFYGLGSDGTVGANKNTVKIVGENTELNAQAYFVYDSKKSGAMTISHLRFSKEKIKAPYLVDNAQFIGVHQFSFFERYEVLNEAADHATLLINAPYKPEDIWYKLPGDAQRQILARNMKLFTIDAYEVARQTGMGGRINTIMQTCFFALSEMLPTEEAIGHIKKAIEKTYAKKGSDVVEKNQAAVDAALAHLYPVPIPDVIEHNTFRATPRIPHDAPHFVRYVTAAMLEGKGDLLPVSAMPVDGTWPVGTAKYEKRNIAQKIPVWNSDLCIQCNKCVMVCPHTAVRSRFYHNDALEDAPETFKHVAFKDRAKPDHSLTIQVAPEDCTGCELCVHVCPGISKEDPAQKALLMAPQPPLREQENANFEFFESLPEVPVEQLKENVREVGFRHSYFEFSGACAGCGETPYIRLLTQLVGDRLYMANATGCSSIFGGNLPTTPYTTDAEGRGPAWANSLFEDNAEFGLGIRLAVDQKEERARMLLQNQRDALDNDLVSAILNSDQSDAAAIKEQRERIQQMREQLGKKRNIDAGELISMADYLVKKSVWVVGGDGWAYDIGYGGLDHVLATGANINILVLDTGTYSNTGGQQSKATPLGATAKFATSGKKQHRKELGMLALMYGNVYVAQVALGASDAQVLKALREAEAFDGPSIVIAYSHCISHGFNLCNGLDHQKNAVESGAWTLFRYNPTEEKAGKRLAIDSRKPKKPLREFLATENRFRHLKNDTAAAKETVEMAEEAIRTKHDLLKQIADSVNHG